MYRNKNIFLKIKTTLKVVALLLVLLLFKNCEKKVTEINIGYIGPLTTRATDLGIAPSKALQLAVDEYNSKRRSGDPIVNLFIEDDEWKKEKAIPAYNRLKKNHKIKVLFISNTGGTIAISEAAKKDGVIVINPLNNDASLNKLNNNIFRIAKSTEEVHSLIAKRIIDLDFKKAIIMHYPNDFMTLGAKTCQNILNQNNIYNEVVSFAPDKKEYTKELAEFKSKGFDAYVFFGYKDFGFAMKQARDIGIDAKFFGSTVLLEEDYYNNSEGAISGTEFLFFTPENENYILAQNFLNNYEKKYNSKPFSIWPPMQAYDAANILFQQLKSFNQTYHKKENSFDDWLRNKLLNVRFYEGVCGNISINPNGSSSGIYFSLYKYTTKGKFVTIN